MPDLVEQILIATLPPLATLLLAWLAGMRLSASWDERRKRRELELALADSFYSSYGEFCAIWKEWNWHCGRSDSADPAGTAERQSAMLERACRAEGAMEAVLLKIAVERRLDPRQAEDLGNLRQAYQVLRERIREGVPVSYGASEHRDYLEFKRLATFVGHLLAASPGVVPSAGEAFDSFRDITDNRHEARWRSAGR